MRLPDEVRKEYVHEFLAYLEHPSYIGEWGLVPQIDEAEMRPGILEASNAIKTAIIAIDELNTDPTSERRQIAAKRAVRHINQLPSVLLAGKPYLELTDAGTVRRMQRMANVESGANDKYGSDVAFDVARQIEKFKQWIHDYPKNLFLGVCHLSECERFFIRDRHTARFCQETHRKLYWKHHST